MFYSVKQKLTSLFPKVTQNPRDVAKVIHSGDVQISPVHTCNSADDTLRSTTPLMDEEVSYIGDIIAESPPPIVIDKSPPTTDRTTPTLMRTGSSFQDKSLTPQSIETVSTPLS